MGRGNWLEAKIANTFNSNVVQNDANAENSVPTDEPVEVYESEPAENASNDEIPLQWFFAKVRAFPATIVVSSYLKRACG